MGKRRILKFQARSPLVAADNTCAVAVSGQGAEGCGPWRGCGAPLACYSWTLGESSHETVF